MFSRFGIFLEVSYELETVPQDVTLCLGLGDQKYDKRRASVLCTILVFAAKRPTRASRSALLNLRRKPIWRRCF